MRLTLLHILLSIILIFFTGCVRRPKGVLSDRKMIPVLAEMEIAEGYLHTQTINGDREELRQRLMAGILKDHHISQADFDSTMKWYGKNPDVYYKLGSELNAEIDKLSREYAGDETLAVNEDGNNLWPYRRMAYVDSRNGSEVLTFTLPGADVMKGESLRWKMRLRKEVDATMFMGVDYTDGSSSYFSQRMNGRKRIELDLQTDTALEVRRVFGHLTFADRGDLPLWIDSISLSTAPLDSTKYFQINRQRRVSPPTSRHQSRESNDTVKIN